jgi:predicted RNase H-like nuclease (RuvC/YqgF family)
MNTVVQSLHDNSVNLSKSGGKAASKAMRKAITEIETLEAENKRLEEGRTQSLEIIRRQNARITALESELAASKRECEGLREKLKEHSCMTLDGVEMLTPKHVMVYMILYNDVKKRDVVQGWNTNNPDDIRRSYSTREAAEQALAARDATEGGSDE